MKRHLLILLMYLVVHGVVDGQTPFNTKDKVLDITGLPPGIYHITYTTITTQKTTTFIKQ